MFFLKIYELIFAFFGWCDSFFFLNFNILCFDFGIAINYDTIFIFMIFFFLLGFIYIIIFILDPIIALLSLICIITIFCLFWIYFGLDFFGFIFLMVYVGAIAILFLFAIMMLNLQKISQNKVQLSLNLKFKLFSIFSIFLIIFSFLFSYIYFTIVSGISSSADSLTPFIISYTLELNFLRSVGAVFYTTYAYYFFLSGLILFLGMFGPIILTFNGGVAQQFLFKKHFNFLVQRPFLLNLKKKKFKK